MSDYEDDWYDDDGDNYYYVEDSYGIAVLHPLPLPYPAGSRSQHDSLDLPCASRLAVDTVFANPSLVSN